MPVRSAARSPHRRVAREPGPRATKSGDASRRSIRAPSLGGIARRLGIAPEDPDVVMRTSPAIKVLGRSQRSAVVYQLVPHLVIELAHLRIRNALLNDRHRLFPVHRRD